MAAGNPFIPYDSIRIREVGGRYFPPGLLESILEQYLPLECLSTPGTSVEGRDIKMVRLGSGPVRVLMWSQMHGNESTTTKAVLDLVRYLLAGPGTGSGLLGQLEICLIPMLNPDGAIAYTRVNANQVDLNRDAAARTQPESRLLREVFEAFRPDFCFNLHDQRSIYGVGETGVSATLSFLAPAADKQRRVTPSREVAMKLIAGLAARLSEELPGGIGRYDDAFNADCVGDQFQMAGVPTLLFEAGHYPHDYARETTRRFVFGALVEALRQIAGKQLYSNNPGAYASIPENGKNFADILILNPAILHRRYAGQEILALHYREELRNGEVELFPSQPERGLTEARFGHARYDASRPEDRERLMSQPLLSKLFL